MQMINTRTFGVNFGIRIAVLFVFLISGSHASVLLQRDWGHTFSGLLSRWTRDTSSERVDNNAMNNARTLRLLNGAQYNKLDEADLKSTLFFARISVDARPWYEYNNSAMCGGTVVSPKIIVTAAHCVRPRLDDGGLSISFIPPEFLSVRIGATDMSAESGYGMMIDTIYVKEGYDSSTLTNDIAVIRLASPIPDEHYLPIVIGNLTEGPHLGQSIGMGASTSSEGGSDSRVLRSAIVLVTFGEGCPDDRICAIPIRSSIGALCMYDSGGPLLTFSKTLFRVQLVGIAKSVTSAACIEQSVTNYYTPVMYFYNDVMDFINEATPAGWVNYTQLE